MQHLGYLNQLCKKVKDEPSKGYMSYVIGYWKLWNVYL